MGKTETTSFFASDSMTSPLLYQEGLSKPQLPPLSEFSNISKTQINENDEKLSSKQNLLKTSHWLKVVQTGYLGLTQAKMW